MQKIRGHKNSENKMKIKNVIRTIIFVVGEFLFGLGIDIDIFWLTSIGIILIFVAIYLALPINRE